MKVNKIYVKNKNTRYTIIIGKDSLGLLKKQVNTLCPQTKKIGLILDKNIPNHFKRKIKKQLRQYNVFIYEFLPNEKLKSFREANDLLEKLIRNNLNRNDTIITVGGGIIGDFGSFVASIYKRGINLINIPSTLLAQVDSSIGGKTAVNSESGKNLIGTFYQPKLVLSDLTLLKSLSKRNLVCGFAEILKHSLIKDSKFFKKLEKNKNNIFENFDFHTMAEIISKSCKIKLSFVNKDEKEKNDRMILNFGHTFAHAIEVSNKYSGKINHGEAVLAGMILATRLSFVKKVCSRKTLDKIENLYSNSKLLKKFLSFLNKKNLNKIVNFMVVDKKNYDKKINLILIKRIGKTTRPGQYRLSPNEMKKVLKKII
tara:strand:- start:303 stop:1412 length:1110 start_codon:yes stop_codon:yes gene_type:complete